MHQLTADLQRNGNPDVNVILINVVSIDNFFINHPWEHLCWIFQHHLTPLSARPAAGTFLNFVEVPWFDCQPLMIFGCKTADLFAVDSNPWHHLLKMTMMTMMLVA